MFVAPAIPDTSTGLPHASAHSGRSGFTGGSLSSSHLAAGFAPLLRFFVISESRRGYPRPHRRDWPCHWIVKFIRPTHHGAARARAPYRASLHWVIASSAHSSILLSRGSDGSLVGRVSSSKLLSSSSIGSACKLQSWRVHPSHLILLPPLTPHPLYSHSATLGTTPASIGSSYVVGLLPAKWTVSKNVIVWLVCKLKPHICMARLIQ